LKTTRISLQNTMPNFVWCFISISCVAAFADEDDNVQLIQTRILQKGPVVDLATSAAQTLCLNTHSSGWTTWDCDGSFGKKAAAPKYCTSTNAGYKNAVANVCCANSCGMDISTSAGQTLCLNTHSSGWNTWDCDGTGGNKAAAPKYCTSTNAGYRNAVATVCCADSCGMDISTSAGQTLCLNTHSSGWTTWDCDGTGGKKAAAPKYCTSTNAGYRNAVATACCAESCGSGSTDITTSAGQTECLNTHSSGWTTWDCDGTGGKKAAAPKYCTSTNAGYRNAVATACCAESCGSGSTDITTSAGQTECLNTYSAGWNNWDCDGTGGKHAAAPAYCNSGNGGYRKSTTTCCPQSCLTVSTTTTTTIPGGDTIIGGADCFGAVAGWGPDFDCNDKSDMFCGDDSADGLDVGLCCQDHCGTKQESHSKKKEAEGDRKQAEGALKSIRRESNSKRRDAESTRKKEKKEDEWLSKRSGQETKNKNSEDENKNKKGYSEGKRKNERSWKGNRGAERRAARKRESSRKSARENGEQKNKNGISEGKKKDQAGNQSNQAQRKEKRIKKRAEKKKKQTGGGRPQVRR